MAGLFFTATGLLLTADNLDLVDADRYLRFWPGLLIVVGVFKLIDRRSSRFVAVALIIAGTWLLALSLDLVRFTLFDLWPLILIAVGLAFLGRAFGIMDPTERLASASAANNLSMFAVRKIVETSQDYRGGNMVALLGGHELDLTGASITNAPAVIDAFAFWGSIEIVVPDDWEIVSEVTPIMAGFEARSGTNADPRKRLIIRGAALMAGIEVRNASRRAS
jgi:predicted membrane protein